jgi:hypothetical protein
MNFLLDSNCFILAFRVSYPPDIAVSFWKKFEQLSQQHRFYSLVQVKNELYTNDDELCKWCKDKLPADFFLPFPDTAYIQYEKLVKWAESKDFTERAKEKFLDATKADIYLAAFAAQNNQNWTIVTQEVSAPYAKGIIKLPDACTAVNVKAMNMMDMFRTLKETF